MPHEAAIDEEAGRRPEQTAAGTPAQLPFPGIWLIVKDGGSDQAVIQSMKY